MKRRHPATDDALQLLGVLVAQGRRRRAWTQVELAERAGVSPPTIAKIENGDPGVAIGTAFEAAVLVGVDLFDVPPDSLSEHVENQRNRLALLPARVRTTVAFDDDF
ncbi:transcriptional regulator with XRE-family HTH domain [Kineosphaera limosa]|uniref:Putative Xre family DNA-binding protein n=1 Tax=Kineosphaera limosa NBRC 100340 TaxID=1184609 RepID=K6X9E1_9MICO|nr:helix-turn-helix transcriptional regulator [Kineosphaera limosa]NYE01388.1 transcriptional regulator with XRE-family HTH domain [Kineosphaera limosa]GAB95439.1 putative Xre family DNA-binding protein [Kineosphaera limosa NBRC 100340]